MVHGLAIGCEMVQRIRYYTKFRRGGRDLNPRLGFIPSTRLAGGRTKPDYATSPGKAFRDEKRWF